jgi:hypothetical protein
MGPDNSGVILNAFYFVVGLVLVVLTSVGILFILVLPRQPSGLEKSSLWVNRAVRFVFLLLSRLARSYEAKDAILAPIAPVALIAQLLFWSMCLTLGFALMLMNTVHSFGPALLQALTALFTVGSYHVGGTANPGIDIAAGAMWVVVVALQIAYLPSLYSAFSRRESLVAMLESRAGVPAWGPELLMRHQLVGITDSLPNLYVQWEGWASEVAESHTTYPVLLLFRSPEPWYSWLIGLLAVLDAGAMQLALCPSTAPSSARLCLRMGFTLINRIGRTMGMAIDEDPDPEGPLQLTYDEFAAAVAQLESTGFVIERPAEEAWPHFVGWRVNYEAVTYALADRLVAPPAPWSGKRSHLSRGSEGPHRPPHRRPGSSKTFTYSRPDVVNPGRDAR